MTSIVRSASRLVKAACLAALALAGTTGTAGAEKPAGACPPAFSEISEVGLRLLFGDRDDFAALFGAIDKNGDGTLCARQTPGLYNTVDNVARLDASLR